MHGMTLIQVILRDRLVLNELDFSSLVFLLDIGDCRCNRQSNAGLSELHQISDQLSLEVTMKDRISFFSNTATHYKPIVPQIRHGNCLDRDQWYLPLQ